MDLEAFKSHYPCEKGHTYYVLTARPSRGDLRDFTVAAETTSEVEAEMLAHDLAEGRDKEKVDVWAQREASCLSHHESRRAVARFHVGGADPMLASEVGLLRRWYGQAQEWGDPRPGRLARALQVRATDVSDHARIETDLLIAAVLGGGWSRLSDSDIDKQCAYIKTLIDAEDSNAREALREE